MHFACGNKFNSFWFKIYFFLGAYVRIDKTLTKDYLIDDYST